MAKNLDGIKKLSPEDIKKYRKVVLDYIGEKDSTETLDKKNSNQEIIRSRKVDGVNLNKINRFAAKGKEILKKIPVQDEPASSFNGKKEESAKSNREMAERLKEAVKRQEEERKRIKIEEGQYQLKKEQAEKDRRDKEERLRQEKIRLEEERVEQERIKQKERERAEEAKKWEEKRKADEKIRVEKERIKQEKIRKIETEKQKKKLAEKQLHEQQELVRQEELKKKEIVEQAKRKAAEIRRVEEARKYQEKIKLEEQKREERRIVRENIRLEKQKREEEVRRIKQAEKIVRQAAREKKKIKRLKAWKKIKSNFKFKLNNFLSEVKKNAIYIISFLILFLAIAYIIFCLAVLRFKINNVTGWAANYLPVPAIITSQGIISYNDFRKIEDKNYLSLTLAGKKAYLAQWIVRRDLREKYKFFAELAGGDLAIIYILDKDFNQVGLSRINKISESLKSPGGIEPFAKYADEYNDGVYYDSKSATEKFGLTVLKLAIGETSGIIAQADGYYILERLDDRNGELGLKYLFIKAQTLEQYVSKKSGRTKVFILTN